MKVKRTERGWVGHYILGDRCKFRRNTLLEFGDQKVVVSTVGALVIDGEMDTVGCNRWYETMAFGARTDGDYIEADVSKQYLPVAIDWGLWASTWEELEKNYPGGVDNHANQMHENIVSFFIEKLEKGELDEYEYH